MPPLPHLSPPDSTQLNARRTRAASGWRKRLSAFIARHRAERALLHARCAESGLAALARFCAENAEAPASGKERSQLTWRR